LPNSSPSLAEDDAAAGELAFTATCGACHSTKPGVNQIGPSLAGIVGAKSGAAPGYIFSPVLKAANITWNGIARRPPRPMGYRRADSPLEGI